MWLLLQGRLKMMEIGERLFEIQTECGLDLSRHDYFRNLNYGLVEVVYEWARGMVSGFLFEKRVSSS